jgi:hypothetical protein
MQVKCPKNINLKQRNEKGILQKEKRSGGYLMNVLAINVNVCPELPISIYY